MLNLTICVPGLAGIKRLRSHAFISGVIIVLKIINDCGSLTPAFIINTVFSSLCDSGYLIYCFGANIQITGVDIYEKMLYVFYCK